MHKNLSLQMPDPGHPWFDFDCGRSSDLSVCSAFPPEGQWRRMPQTRHGLKGLTATGIVPDLHRIPFSRTPGKASRRSHRNPMQIYAFDSYNASSSLLPYLLSSPSLPALASIAPMFLPKTSASFFSETRSLQSFSSLTSSS